MPLPRALSVAFIPSLLLAANTAWAAPVANWDYVATSAFVTTDGATTFKAGEGCQTITPTSISWGEGAPNCMLGPQTGRSGIGISNNGQSGTIQTNGAAAPANTYTHANYPISSIYATLTSATLTSTLQLRELGSTGPYESFTATYKILFDETVNAEPCSVASPVPCNDIWVLQGSVNNSFTLNGETYFVSYFAAPELTALPSAVCQAIAGDPLCAGFTTVEGQTNEVSFMLRITNQPLTIPGNEVPEPSTLALLGAGLLGSLALRRRRG